MILKILQIYIVRAIQPNSFNSIIIIVISISTSRHRISLPFFYVVILNRNTQALRTPLRTTRCIRFHFNAAEMIGVYTEQRPSSPIFSSIVPSLVKRCSYTA